MIICKLYTLVNPLSYEIPKKCKGIKCRPSRVHKPIYGISPILCRGMSMSAYWEKACDCNASS